MNLKDVCAGTAVAYLCKFSADLMHSNHRVGGTVLMTTMAAGSVLYVADAVSKTPITASVTNKFSKNFQAMIHGALVGASFIPLCIASVVAGAIEKAERGLFPVVIGEEPR